jgi:hypothetical protein
MSNPKGINQYTKFGRKSAGASKPRKAKDPWAWRQPGSGYDFENRTARQLREWRKNS